jgi:hypothetical protein
LLDDGRAERPLAFPCVRILDQRVGPDRFANGGLVERGRRDRADQAIGVSSRRQVNRKAAAEQQSAVMRGLVIVAVEQNQIAVGDERGQDDLVGRRGAIENEISPLGAEYLRRLFLRGKRRAFMGEEVAELEDRIVEIVAKHRLAEMLHEDAADRAAAIKDPAIMTRAGPQLIAFLGVIDQRAEKRRLQCLCILREPADEIARDEFRRLFGEKDVAVDEVEHFHRHVFKPPAAHEQHDRHFEAAPAHQIDQRRALALEPLLAPIDDQAADGGVGLHREFGVLDPRRSHDLKAEPLNGGDDLLDAQAFKVFGFEIRRREEERESLDEVHWGDRPIHLENCSLLFWMTAV